MITNMNFQDQNDSWSNSKGVICIFATKKKKWKWEFEREMRNPKGSNDIVQASIYQNNVIL